MDKGSMGLKFEVEIIGSKKKMQRVLRLHFASIVGGDTRDPMSVALGESLERDVLQWVPSAPVSSVPWASMTKSKAISQAAFLVSDQCASFLFSMRSLSEPVAWSPDVERRIVLGQAASVSEAISALDHTLASPVTLVGAACRTRFLMKRPCLCTGTVDTHLWVRGVDGQWRNIQTQTVCKENSKWSGCSLFASVPKSDLLIAIRGSSVLLGTFAQPQLAFQTTVRDADMMEVEIVPSGAIVLTVGRRNEDTGGSFQHESVAFRLNESASLESVTLTVDEAKEAEAACLSRESTRQFDFSRVSSPLAARVVSPWASDIVLQEDIVFEDMGHGSVVGLMGHANDMWIAHATGVVIHVVDGAIVQRVDVGTACTHAVSFPHSFKPASPA
jgi:hypothetical protein